MFFVQLGLLVHTILWGQGCAHTMYVTQPVIEGERKQMRGRRWVHKENPLLAWGDPDGGHGARWGVGARVRSTPVTRPMPQGILGSCH